MAATMRHYVDHFEEIPVVVLACHQQYREPSIVDGASVYPACQNLLLAAHALGYGATMTIWHALVEDDLRRVLAIPDDVTLAATITMGVPVGRHGPVRRRPLGELVHEDRWVGPPPWATDPAGTRFTSAGPPKRSS